MNTKIWKRTLAGLLAGILYFTGVPFSAAADEPPVQMIIRGDAFQNRQINIFRAQPQVDHLLLCESGGRSCTCILFAAGQETAKSYPGSLAALQRITETSIPVIGSFDRYLPMMMAYEWMVSGNYYDKTRYAVVQTYFWGCLASYEREMGCPEDTMKKLEWAIGDGRVLSVP